MNDPISGEMLVPADCVTFAPDEKKLKTSWAVLNDTRTKWTYQQKPTTAAECVGIKVKHSDQCPEPRERTLDLHLPVFLEGLKICIATVQRNIRKIFLFSII